MLTPRPAPPEDLQALAAESDNEINPQTVPARVWEHLTVVRRAAHEAPMHRGRLYDQYFAYLDGAADALGFDRDDLDTAIALGWPQTEGKEVTS